MNDLTPELLQRLKANSTDITEVSLRNVDDNQFQELCEALKNNTYVKKLSISSQQLSNIKPIASLKHLTELDLSYCKSLNTLEGLENLQDLEALKLTCTAIVAIDVLATLPKLREVNLSDCTKIKSFTVLGRLPHLEILCLDRIMANDLSWLSTLTSLSNLSLVGLNCELAFLEALTNLEVLNIGWNYKITHLNFLEGLEKLRKLKVDQCENIINFEGLGNLKSLEKLEMMGVKQFRQLDVLQNLLKVCEFVWSGLQTSANMDFIEAWLERNKQIKERMKKIEGRDHFKDGFEIGMICGKYDEKLKAALQARGLSFRSTSSINWSSFFGAQAQEFPVTPNNSVNINVSLPPKSQF